MRWARGRGHQVGGRACTGVWLARVFRCYGPPEFASERNERMNEGIVDSRMKGLCSPGLSVRRSGVFRCVV